MKKTIILPLVVIIVITTVSFAYFYKYAGGMVLQDVANIESIVIAMYPYDTNKVVIQDREEINKVYDILLQTSDITNNRHPSHLESIQHDPKFAMYVKYKDGKMDRISASARTNYIILFLNSKGSSGDPGYREGKNQMIWEYVLK